jgi:hypothetical protein
VVRVRVRVRVRASVGSTNIALSLSKLGVYCANNHQFLYKSSNKNIIINKYNYKYNQSIV